MDFTVKVNVESNAFIWLFIGFIIRFNLILIREIIYYKNTYTPMIKPPDSPFSFRFQEDKLGLLMVAGRREKVSI